MGTEKLAEFEKASIIRAIHDTHRREINFHQETMNKTTQWATSVYLAIGAALLLLGSDNWRRFGETGQIFVFSILFLITLFVVAQLRHSASAIDTNAAIVVKADRVMGLFDHDTFLPGEQIYPTKWLRWGTKKGAGYYDVFHIAISILLALSVGILAYIL